MDVQVREADSKGRHGQGRQQLARRDLQQRAVAIGAGIAMYGRLVGDGIDDPVLADTICKRPAGAALPWG